MPVLRDKHGRIHVGFILAVALIVFVGRIIPTWGIFNDTIDEPYHIGAGISMFEAHRLMRSIQSPPLPRLVAASPLISGIDVPADRHLTTIQPDLTAFNLGHAVLMHGELPYWSGLRRARAAMLVFPIAAIIYVYLLARYVGGRFVGCVSAVFFSTDPTLLGHSTWVAVNVAATAGLAAAIYHGVRFIAHPTRFRAALAGGVSGLAIACKFSCVGILPALLVPLLFRPFRAWPKPSRVALAFACGFVTLWGCYFFDVGRLKDSDLASVAAVPGWIRAMPLPMPSAIAGFLEVARHNQFGHAAYLNGVTRNGGWWYYFPEAIVLKSPVALLAGLSIVLAIIVFRRTRLPRWTILCSPALAILVPAMLGNLNIGIRHVLPAIPFLYVLVVYTMHRARLGPTAITLLLIAFLETIWVHPDYLAFFNILAGGPANGGRFLLDSNLDWGQDHARLKRWLDEHAQGREVTLRLFGNVRLRGWPHSGYEFVPPLSPPHGLLAISKSVAGGIFPRTYTTEGGLPMIEPPIPPLHRLRHIARIGYSIDIYDLDGP